MILGFAHPAIVVPDLEKAHEFYEKMLGFSTVAEESWEADNEMFNLGVGLRGSAARYYMLKGHNCFLELFEFASPARTGPSPETLGAHELGIRHLAFYVDDVWREFERLKALGGIHMNEPVGNEELGWAIYCRDPFGNIIELCTPRDSSEELESLPGVIGNGAYQP